MHLSVRTTLVLLLILSSITLRAQEIGLQLYSLRNQFATDVPGTMAKIKSFGIKEIELGGSYGLPFPDFIKLLAQNQLQVVSFGTDFDRLMNFPQAVADDARAYGAKFVVCFWIPHNGDTFTVEDADKAAAVFNRAGKILAQNGLLLCYHPHGYEFQPHEKGTLFDYMLDVFDTRYVYMEMDVFWVKQAGQDPIALLKKYANRWVLLHLKDRKKGTADSLNGKADEESNVVLGKGDVGIAQIMKEAKAIGIKHYFIEDESSKAELQIPESLTYLRSLK
ncbi:MAG TPA: sugar phosphate isomerase/epimerase [Ohtaekwangia sp.]|uniref:sugar phosphate isomerase/epimerase family protein n=1 Tax=Ohtaekwangia sp. TaxID=2066019 RepID=UPI002F95A86B